MTDRRENRCADLFIGSDVLVAIDLEFDRPTLGGLPSEFGFVLTDTGTGGFFIFVAFDGPGAFVGRARGFLVGDGEVLGATAEDRFFGITHSGGIGSVRITLLGPLDEFVQLEIDHVQYGAIVPEPSSGLLIGVGMIVMLGVRWRGRRRRGLAPFCALASASGLCGETDDTNPKRQRGKCAH